MQLGPNELRQPGVQAFDWSAGVPLPGAAGRGGVCQLATTAGTAVIRHYRRGGALAALLGDRYWYFGAESTRCFREFRLLQRLVELDLPVCRPLAARFLRSGPWYRADLATLLIPEARSLHQLLRQQGPSMDIAEAVGELVARFHRVGLWHADLNAHNVLCDAQGQFWLIDLDRSRMRSVAAGWQRENLWRLLRSLRKLGHLGAATDAFWQRLEQAWSSRMQGADRR